MARHPFPLLECGTFGGFMPPVERFTELPDLVLYPDGTLLSVRQPAWVRPVLQRRRLTPGQVESVLEGVGGELTGLRESYLWDEATDAGTSHIRLRTGASVQDVGVYAFRAHSHWPAAGHPQRADLERFARAWDHLAELARAPGEEYIPGRLAVYAAVESGEATTSPRTSLTPGDLDLWPVLARGWAPPVLHVRLRGKTAAWVYALLSRSDPGRPFAWGQLVARLAYRPVLPHER